MSQELTRAIRRLFGRRRTASGEAVSVVPGCVFGAVADQRIKEVAREVAELRSRVNGLIFLLAGAVGVEVVLRLLT